MTRKKGTVRKYTKTRKRTQKRTLRGENSSKKKKTRKRTQKRNSKKKIKTGNCPHIHDEESDINCQDYIRGLNLPQADTNRLLKLCGLYSPRCQQHSSF